MTFELETSDPRPRRYLPAWCLSLGLHAFLVLILAFGLRGAATSPAEPPVRAVGIVLAESPNEARQRYFQDSDNGDENDSDAGSQDSRSNPAETPPHGTSLPGDEVAGKLALPEIQLPGPIASVGSADDLVVDSLGRTGRRSTSILPGLGDDAILAEEAARRAAEAAKGPATRVSIFGSAPAAGRSFVFAIDRSKSMGGDGLNALAAARTELVRSLKHLTPKHSFQIVAYNHQCVYLTRPRLLPATEENRAAVSPFIENLAAFGGTVHEMALRAALAMEPDAVFLLTDGGDPHLNEIQLANIRKLAAGRTSIHCLRFGFGPAVGEAHFMNRLAEENGGAFTYVDMAERR